MSTVNPNDRNSLIIHNGNNNNYEPVQTDAQISKDQLNEVAHNQLNRLGEDLKEKYKGNCKVSVVFPDMVALMNLDSKTSIDNIKRIIKQKYNYKFSIDNMKMIYAGNPINSLDLLPNQKWPSTDTKMNMVIDSKTLNEEKKEEDSLVDELAKKENLLEKHKGLCTIRIDFRDSNLDLHITSNTPLDIIKEIILKEKKLDYSKEDIKLYIVPRGSETIYIDELPNNQWSSEIQYTAVYIELKDRYPLPYDIRKMVKKQASLEIKKSLVDNEKALI